MFDESNAKINALSAVARDDATRYAREELDKAIARKNDILSKAGMQVDPQLDVAIRADYNIYFR